MCAELSLLNTEVGRFLAVSLGPLCPGFSCWCLRPAALRALWVPGSERAVVALLTLHCLMAGALETVFCVSLVVSGEVTSVPVTLF